MQGLNLTRVEKQTTRRFTNARIEQADSPAVDHYGASVIGLHLEAAVAESEDVRGGLGHPVIGPHEELEVAHHTRVVLLIILLNHNFMFLRLFLVLNSEH